MANPYNVLLHSREKPESVADWSGASLETDDLLERLKRVYKGLRKEVAAGLAAWRPLLSLNPTECRRD